MTELNSPTPIVGTILTIGGVVVALLATFIHVGGAGYPHSFGNTVGPWITLGGLVVAGLGMVVMISYWAGYDRANRGRVEDE